MYLMQFQSKKCLVKYFKSSRLLLRYCSIYKFPSKQDEYTETPQYPPILSLTKKAVEQRDVESFYNKIERQSTVEEKLFMINMPRYYGWNCVMLNEGEIPYNSLNFVQYVTRTHLINDVEQPSILNENLNQAKDLAKTIKDQVENEISHQLSVRRKWGDESSEINIEKQKTTLLLNALHRLLKREIIKNTSHLSACETDYTPRIEAFWSVGGINPPKTVRKRRKEEDPDIKDDELDAPINRWVQYLGSPALQVRHTDPLPPFWSPEVRGDVPQWKIEPDVIGFQNEYRHGTSIPGFWPGESREFPVLSYHLTHHLQHRPPSYGEEEKRDALVSQGILSSFGWLVPLVAYQGFSPFSEITYPLSTQTILTNGREFSFMMYQMNTNLVHSEHANDTSKTNLAWCSPSTPLYDSIEDGKIMGLNEDVLTQLVQMYLTKPEARPDVNLKPYLGADIQRIAQYDDEEKRVWLEREFKHFSSNRPRHRTDLMYELYEWERIYKVEHKTRPRDALLRPFELRQHPYRRAMSQHGGQYIQKHLRPDKDIPKWRQRRFKKTFYPE